MAVTTAGKALKSGMAVITGTAVDGMVTDTLASTSIRVITADTAADAAGSIVMPWLRAPPIGGIVTKTALASESMQINRTSQSLRRPGIVFRPRSFCSAHSSISEVACPDFLIRIKAVIASLRALNLLDS